MQPCTIKIGTFNLFNLIKPGINFYERDPLSEDNYNRKINWVANQLKEMDCDIVAFQEVFHGSALEEAIDKSGIYAGLKPVILQENEKEVKPKVALLSKFPILQVNFISKFPKQCDFRFDKKEFPIFEFHRPILRAVIALPNGADLIVYAVHFKSNLPLIEENQDRSDPFAFATGKAKAAIMRTAEAAALRCLVVNDLKNTTNPLCVIGDFNDTIHGPINRILTGEMPYERIRDKEKQAIYRTILHNTYFITARRSFRDVFYTNIHAGMHEALDHILVSDDFFDENPDRIGLVEGLFVLNDHLAEFERLPKSQFYYKSDHGQVVAILSLNPQRQKCNRPEEDFQKFY
jgi:endonuclease/exonuclease/phosphatase family metal-dependent hydrolase